MQTDLTFRLAKPLIVESVVDIDCDMPPGYDVIKLENVAREQLRDKYPKIRKVLLQEHKLEAKPDAPPTMEVRRAVQALQFTQDDEKQIVQVRAQGYSFNRLAPYTTLDDYLPEIERTWKLFVAVARPLEVRAVRLRYINRISLPYEAHKLELDQYLKLGPRLPDEQKLMFTGFLHQHVAVEIETGNQATIVLATEAPENKELPIIFDITASHLARAEAEDWAWILARIQSLRGLKNRIFRNTLTERCLNLFRQP